MSSTRSSRRDYHAKALQQGSTRQARRRNAAVAVEARHDRPRSRRSVVRRDAGLPFSPPEDWYESHGRGDGYRVVQQRPGAGYRHVVTPDDVRQRLAELPPHFLRDLEVVSLSRMTRKKQTLPCYGMQWGSTLYLYPVDDTLEEHFPAPPPTAVVTESKMYGGRWSEIAPGYWKLTWSEAAIRDFYLNNILIHELGHLLDDRNSGYADRERFAEWFAMEYGYRRTGGVDARRPRRAIRKRHHA